MCNTELFFHVLRMQEEREKQAQLRGAPKIDSHVAATLIQKVWRGYWQRKQTAKLRAEELVLLGMKSPPPPKSQKNTSTYLSKKIEVCGMCIHLLKKSHVLVHIGFRMYVRTYLYPLCA